MNLTELENTLSVSFPKLFQDIYNSGMLDYLTCPAGENPFGYKDICGNDREYFFYNCTYDCEWLPFAEFANARTELYEWFDFLIDLAQKQEGLHKNINENFTMTAESSAFTGWTIRRRSRWNTRRICSRRRHILSYRP